MSKVAFLFPGQGSQTVGMGQSFLEHPIGKAIFAEANEALGFDLQKLCLEGPAEELGLTQNTQPAILTVSTIAFRIFQERAKVTPIFAAGHSLGEYSALVAAGVLDFKHAVKAVYLRGKFMQEAVPRGMGGMAAILGKSAEELDALCKECSQPGSVVQPANYNCEGQIVISGHKEAVDRVLEKAKGKALDVSAPFHSPLMQPAADKLAAELEKIPFHDAQFPIVNNADNAILTKAQDFKPSLIKQVTAPVRWETGVQLMIQKGAEHFCEFGQGKVLAGMLKRIDKTKNVTNFQSLNEIEEQAATIASF